MGHLPPNHDVGRMMASLYPQNTPQGKFEHKSCCSVCYTAPRWWKFSSVKRMFSCPFSVCHWRRRSALVRQISFRAGVRRCPFEGRCTLMCTSSLMRHDLIGWICSLSGHDLLFPEWTSVNSLPYRLDSGFIPHIFQASWPSPVFNPPEFLTMFKCPIDKHLRNFQWF